VIVWRYGKIPAGPQGSQRQQGVESQNQPDQAGRNPEQPGFLTDQGLGIKQPDRDRDEIDDVQKDIARLVQHQGQAPRLTFEEPAQDIKSTGQGGAADENEQQAIGWRSEIKTVSGGPE